MSSPNPRKPETWPVIWRVVMPCADQWDRHFVVFESTDERKAREQYRLERQVHYPVRLERVQVGPLPDDYVKSLELWRAADTATSRYKNGRLKPLKLTKPVLGAWVRSGGAP